MEIKIRLFATLREGRGKEMIHQFDQEVTPNDIIELLNIPVEEVAILLINGRDGELSKKLTNQDVVSIFPPVGGG